MIERLCNFKFSVNETNWKERQNGTPTVTFRYDVNIYLYYSELKNYTEAKLSFDNEQDYCLSKYSKYNYNVLHTTITTNVESHANFL